MKKGRKRDHKKTLLFVVIFVAVNLVTAAVLSAREISETDRNLTEHVQNTQGLFEDILAEYKRSFRLFSQMLSDEIKNHPEPDDIWNYLKSIDKPLLEIEGETFDGLYLYYQGRYLYSWDTPYSVYEESGYVVQERPWYQAALKGKGEIVFTPPYMSYANHYILTTISQLQPDGETVFAYDIKMGDIQNLVSSLDRFEGEEIMIFDGNGTVIGSTNADYLGGDLDADLEETALAAKTARMELDDMSGEEKEEVQKAQDKAEYAQAFYDFMERFQGGFQKLNSAEEKVLPIKIDKTWYFGCLSKQGDYGFLIFAPVTSILKETVNIWLVPLLAVELILIYLLGHASKEMKNRELREAYVQLGQIQRRLEIALSAAQKAAAIDDLTGMMNVKSFQKEVTNLLEVMDQNQRGILIMIDGDRFKQVNDNYGHNVGDEVIKLSAQMIIGRIRTVDFASRLHGDEFAIFVSDAADYEIARSIMKDINGSIAKTAVKQNMPAITLSAGAVIAKHGDNYMALSKAADEALYKAKVTHNGAVACVGE